MSLGRGYEVYTDRKFEKWIRKNLPPKYKSLLDQKLAYFKENPEHPSLNTKPYAGVGKLVLKQLDVDAVYEFYINKDYRVVLYVSHERKEIILAFVGDHDEVRKFVRHS